MISVFLLTGILFSFPLWRSDRLFPLAPVFSFFPKFVPPVDTLVVVALLLALGTNIFLQKKPLHSFVLVLLLVLLLQDQMRWQPWVYIYILMLVIVSPGSENASTTRIRLQILLVCVYMWSGIHKLNPNFIDLIFPGILHLFSLSLESVVGLKKLGYALPAMELAIGAGLFFPATRKFAVYLAAAMHVFILVYVSPLGIHENHIIIPWNIAMIGFLTLIFFRTKNRIFVPPSTNVLSRLKTGLVILVAGVLPAGNFIGLWDHYLSFSFYSGKVNSFYIAVQEDGVSKIDHRLSDYFAAIEGLQGGKLIDVNRWSESELRVPVYPEKRVFKRIGESFCSLGLTDDQLVFIELERPFARGKFFRWTCQDFREQ